jgi:hypothetical protein
MEEAHGLDMYERVTAETAFHGPTGSSQSGFRDERGWSNRASSQGEPLGTLSSTKPS